MPMRDEKVTALAEAIRRIEDGSTIALGGLSYFSTPMAIVREIIRQKKKDLTLITAAVTGPGADLLIGAGCVRRLISPYVGFEELGAAPNFRRAAERGEIEIEEIGEAFLAFGLKAAAAGAPFYALPDCLANSDLVRVNHSYRLARDPFTDQKVICVPALRPDWALLHAQQSDPFGNARHLGSAYMDKLLARAAKRVILSCDQLITNQEIRSEPHRTTIPAICVDAIVVTLGGAHPTASEPLYDVDRNHLRSYLNWCKTPEGTSGYMAEFVLSTDEPGYLKKVDFAKANAELGASPTADENAPESPAEFMAIVFSRLVEDGDFVGVGTGCWEVAAGLRLAQLTRAPNLSFTMGGTAALNPDMQELPLSVNSAGAIKRCEAILDLEELFDLELKGKFDVMFLSGLQIDKRGNVNLVGIGPWSAPKLRGPGSVGLELAPCARRRVAFFRRHTPQVFVERVDFISAPGCLQEVARAACDNYLVVTNLAVMGFNEEGYMQLVSLHPGVTLEQVLNSTGFELIIPAQVPMTDPPRPEELRLLRTRVDQAGMLRKIS
jgi:glutaconate CoA-transferase subunit A